MAATGDRVSPHQAHKPKVKPKPAVLQRWNFTENEDNVVSPGSAQNVKAQRKLFENRDHVKKTAAATKPPVDKSSKPKLLPKPGEVKAHSVAAEAAPDSVSKPLAKPRKISNTHGPNTEHIPQRQAANSSVDPLRRESNTGTETSSEELHGSNKTKLLHNARFSHPRNCGDQECAKKPETKVTHRKLRGTLLRGFEVAFKGDAKPLADLRRRSEESGDIKEALCVSGGESTTEGRVEEYSTDDNSGSDYDDVEIGQPGRGGGFVQVDVSSTQPIEIPKPAPRWNKKLNSSDRGTRRKKIESKERFKSDPDLIRASALYDDIDLHQDSSMNKDSKRETVSSGDEYEEIDDSLVPTSFVKSMENIVLPQARSPTTPKLLEKVRTRVGKTVDKAKNRFFTSVSSSPTNSASPVGSPKLRGREISPPIPEKPTSVVKVTPGMRTSSSDPAIQNMASKPVLNKSLSVQSQISENFPSFPPPPPPSTDHEGFESSGEGSLPPVPPRGSSRELDAIEEGITVPSRHMLQTMHTEDSMARCESLQDLDGGLSHPHDGDEAYSEVVMGVTRP